MTDGPGQAALLEDTPHPATAPDDPAERAASAGERVPRRRVALVIASLGWGGAQKVIVEIANHWAARGWAVTLISVGGDRAPPYFPRDPRLDVIFLGYTNASSHALEGARFNLRRILALRRTIRQSRAEAVVSFLSATNARTLLATAGLGLRVIVSERGDPRRASLSRTWRLMRSLAYPFAYRLVAQTEQALACFGPLVRRKGVVIPNPVVIPPRPVAGAHKTVVAVGHLAPVKGFDLLVEAFARCAPAHPEWRLVIWGEGDQRTRLEELSARLGVGERVAMPGRSARPGIWVQDAGIFVLSSRHEGFPNVLLEAMAAGLPVVATDCPVGGARTLLDNGTSGRLVPSEDIAALAAALDGLMANPAERRRLGEAARRSVARYAHHDVMAQWTRLVEEDARPTA